MNPSRLLPLAALALSACVSHVPRIEIPDRVEANCENRAVKQTALDAIVASADDTVHPAPYPGDAALHATIKRLGGAFAYWKAQPYRAPGTAKALGLSGDMLTLTRAVVTNEIDTAKHSRPIWLTFATPQGERTVYERAYDIQNVCIEGRPDI
ncbi:MAG: hypothetical protein QOI11_2101 [Candidatus Eremiobacteraeota bacterium]|nr:hypothetical protein [Candidatus Eremiobacteraeota bacterium]